MWRLASPRPSPSVPSPLALSPLALSPLAPSPLALSRRPGTTATPLRSAAWANALLSAGPGIRTHRVRPPSGSGQVQAGSSDRSAPASASCLPRSHSPRHLAMTSC